MTVKKTLKILGVPGAGKTTYCYNLILEFINTGYKIEDICFTTFTKAAIESIKEKFIDNNVYINKNINFKTLNSLTWKLSKYTSEDILYNEMIIKYFKDNKLTTYTNKKQKKKLMKSDLQVIIELYDYIVIRELKNPVDIEETIIKKYISEYLAKNSYFYVQLYLDYMVMTFKNFCQWKQSLNKKLYIDSFIKVLSDKIDISEKILIVDEAQDLNNIQKKLIDMWTKDYNRDIFVLSGDPAQSVHCWANADPNYLIDYSDNNMEIIKLEKSYRLPNNIANLCNDIMKFIHKKDDKIINTDKSDGKIKYLTITYLNLIKQINEIYSKNKLTKSFFLFRTNEVMYNFATLFFKNSDIKFKFIDKDIDRYWNSKFIKCYNAINKINNNINLNKSEAKSIISYLIKKDKTEIYLNRLKELKSDSIQIKDFIKLIDIKLNRNLINYKKDNIYNEIKNIIIDNMKFAKYDNLDKLYKDKLKNNNDIINSVITKNEIIYNIDVLLGTYHSSKGLEADNVFVFLGSSYIFSNIDDSELRCLFTAASRAKKRLYFITSHGENPNLENYFLKIYRSFIKNNKTENSYI